MRKWTGVVLALTPPGGDEIRSRLSTYLHPLAGRPLVWHTVSALASLEPAPKRLSVVCRPELPAELFEGLRVRVRVVCPEGDDLWSAIAATGDPPLGDVLVANAAAPTMGPDLQALLDHPPEWLLPGEGGEVAAALLTGGHAKELLSAGGDLDRVTAVLSPVASVPLRAVVVRRRVELARAVRVLRDRIVRRHMDQGATFLLPDSVLVDVDVRIGRDAVIYPGVVLEGQTTVGDETVIGPGCRIINSQIGNGAELKGWNYISHTFIRNRAILEPYVRRGFD